MKIYKVGMGSDVTEIAAPNAVTAAVYYGVNCIKTNAPSMVVVYKENAEEFNGDSYWMGLSFVPEDEGMKIFERMKAEVADGMDYAGELMWWCPSDGTEPVYGWHGMVYRGKFLDEQCDFATRDENKALRHSLEIVNAKLSVQAN